MDGDGGGDFVKNNLHFRNPTVREGGVTTRARHFWALHLIQILLNHGRSTTAFRVEKTRNVLAQPNMRSIDATASKSLALYRI